MMNRVNVLGVGISGLNLQPCAGRRRRHRAPGAKASSASLASTAPSGSNVLWTLNNSTKTSFLGHPKAIRQIEAGPVSHPALKVKPMK